MPLSVNVRSAQPLDADAEIIVLGVFSFSGGKGSSLPAPLKALDAALGGAFGKLSAREEFTGKRDQVLALPTLGRARAVKAFVVGLGDRKAAGPAELRTFGSKAARLASGEKARALAVGFPEEAIAHVRSLSEGLEIGAYRFTKYLTGDRRPKVSLERVTLLAPTKGLAETKRQVLLGLAIGRAVNLSRDLSNEPPNELYPETLADAAVRMAKANGLKVKVYTYPEILKRGMKLVDAVGRGSRREPRVVHITYTPRKPRKRIVFVGKGLTFDTGGISIKPAPGMEEMKHDMSGAANVVGLLAAVAAIAPDVEVHGILGCAENMPDGNAYRPGDIWGSLDGKTVEIVNTDAEGRLVLADCLAYARALKPDLLVDNATLTGACVVALGSTCSAYYATTDLAADQVDHALRASGEQMWRMPLLEDLREQIKSDVADVKQAGNRFGGSITAALFLREFIGETKNWVHFDIAGPAMAERPNGWIGCKGATGHGVLTFLAMVEHALS